jgi:uncharacterized protein
MNTIILAGGTGQIGQVLTRDFLQQLYKVIVLTRRHAKIKGSLEHVHWDAATLGDWAKHLEGATAVINLAGRSVNCRYTVQNRREILESRVNSTRILGEAIAGCQTPPKVWLQSSTATIYAHRFDAPNDEHTGILGGTEPNTPDTWGFSIAVAKAWEAALESVPTPQTRKVLLRSGMVMSPDKDGVFDVLRGLARVGLGGSMGSGKQYLSWIHATDFVRAIHFLLESNLSGVVNLASPNPLPNAEFMRVLRQATGVRFGVPCVKWMLEVGAFLRQTETELVLKSRRVVPTRLLEAGFVFGFSDWRNAVQNLLKERVS